jgi:hypothetical protein
MDSIGKKELEKLKYRRQYILAPDQIDCPFLYQKTKVSEYYFLYAHVDLPVTTLKNDHSEMVLLGDIFDYTGDHKSNDDILQDLALETGDHRAFLKRISSYTGSFVIICYMENRWRVIHDATATKKVFYSMVKGMIWLSSHPHLLARVLGYHLSEDDSRKAYYGSKECLALNNSGVGTTTCYDEISQLLPNHLLHIPEGTVSRYWPDKVRIPISVEQCVERCTELIHGYMTSIASRYKLMLPVTAGKDSRTLLAATRDFAGEVFYYINGLNNGDYSAPDFRIPVALFKKLGYEFHILEPDIHVDDQFRKIYFENNPHALEAFLPTIYNYYKNFSDRVNLPGSTATSAHGMWPVMAKIATPDDLLVINNLNRFSHAREAYSEWLEDSRDARISSGFNTVDLFYWEDRMANWGTQVQMDKDMAQMDINPYNSRLLAETILSVDRYHSIGVGSYPIHRGINMNLWPETMSVPINPGLKNSIFKVAESLGLLGLIYRIHYR